MSDQSLSLPASAADALLAAHDGDLTLLYLHILRRGGYDAETAARELCRTRGQIDAAGEKLGRLGLLTAPGSPAPPVSDKPVPPEDEPVPPTAEDIVRRAGEDPSFRCVLDEAERAFGRKLSSAELRTLGGTYDQLELPAEVHCELLHYCAEEAAVRHVRLSMRTLVREAYRWNDLEILTLEQVDAHIRAERSRQDAIRRVLPALGIRDREPAPTERKYIGEWLDMGFGEDALAIAYDRTVTKTGRFSWPYMDKIIRTWHARGLHGAAEIEAGDTRAPRRGRKGLVGSADSQMGEIALSELQDLRGKI